MVAHTHTIHQNLHKGVGVGIFEKCAALFIALMILKIIENLLPLDPPAALIQRNGFHQVGIKKSRKFITPGFLYVVI